MGTMRESMMMIIILCFEYKTQFNFQIDMVCPKHNKNGQKPTF